MSGSKADLAQGQLGARGSLLLSAEDAAGILGIGRSHFYGLHSSGRLGPLPIRLGSRTLWSRRELENWVEHGCPARAEWQREKASCSV